MATSQTEREREFEIETVVLEFQSTLYIQDESELIKYGKVKV